MSLDPVLPGRLLCASLAMYTGAQGLLGLFSHSHWALGVCSWGKPFATEVKSSDFSLVQLVLPFPSSPFSQTGPEILN